jgi:hypothetical protein
VTALDPDAGNNLPGYQVIVDGLNRLFSGTGACCQTVVKLLIPQSIADAAGGPVDWPINPGQLIEFRATCTGGMCNLVGGTPYYVRLRSD